MKRLVARILVEVHLIWILLVIVVRMLRGREIDQALMKHRRVCHYQFPEGTAPVVMVRAWKYLAGIECECGRIFYRQKGWLPPTGPWEPVRRPEYVVQVIPIRCTACNQPLVDGDMVVADSDGQPAHLSCPPAREASHG